MDRHPGEWGEPQAPVPWRMLTAAGVAAGLLLAGLAVPALMGDGLDGLPASRRAAAEVVLRHATLGCMDNPIQRGLTRAVRVTWLHPTWQPGDDAHPGEVARRWPPLVVARVSTHTLFGVPAGRITVYAGGGASCWDVDIAREYSLASALAATRDAGLARFMIRLPDDVFPPTGVVGRVDLTRGEAVLDRPPPPGLAGLPYFDAAGLLAAVMAEAPSWVYLGRAEEGARFGRRDMAVAAALDRDWVVVAATIGDGGRLRSVEYLLPAQATLRPAVLRLFDFDGAEPLDDAAAVRS